MSQLDAAFGQNFGRQSDIYQNLTRSLTPTLNAGINQEGFSPEEKAALNTNAINTTGANYRNAAQAVGGQLAGRGDSSGLQSGVDQQIKGDIAAKAAGQLSNEQNQIVQADYGQGRQNYFNALSGLGGVAAGENPTGFAGAANQAGNDASAGANNVAAANAQPWQMVGGLVGGLGAAALQGPLAGGKK